MAKTVKQKRLPYVRKREVTMRLWDGMMKQFWALERRVQAIERGMILVSQDPHPRKAVKS